MLIKGEIDLLIFLDFLPINIALLLSVLHFNSVLPHEMAVGSIG